MRCDSVYLLHVLTIKCGSGKQDPNDTRLYNKRKSLFAVNTFSMPKIFCPLSGFVSANNPVISYFSLKTHLLWTTLAFESESTKFQVLLFSKALTFLSIAPFPNLTSSDLVASLYVNGSQTSFGAMVDIVIFFATA